MKPETISTPQASTPIADELGNSARPWFLYFTALTKRIGVLSDAVMGWANLTRQGRIPKVSEDGTLAESAITDDGKAAVTIINRFLGVKEVAPTTAVDAAGSICSTAWDVTFPAKKFIRISCDPAISGDLLAYDGNLGVFIPLSVRGSVVYVVGNLGPGNNTTPAYPVDTTGDTNTSGVYRVGGTQVVGAQQAAVTAPSGGGTAITAPTGGAVIDIQARAAIAGIISAISSLGNTVDPAARTAINDIRAVLAAHGLTA